jgi:hypothetical protein
MAKLRRKLWVGLGAITIAHAPLAGGTSAQNVGHKGHRPESPAPAAATATPSEGGEAYLTDGGPKDTRIRFYRDIELMRGHLLVGDQLVAKGLWDEALPHFLHPTEELYALLEKYLKLHNIPPFNRDLQALAQAVKTKRKGAYDQRLKVVDRRLTAALDTARRFMTPPARTFTIRSALEVLSTAQTEYQSSIEGGKFVKPVEYQDSRGFAWEAERMFEGIAPDLEKIDSRGLADLRADFARLKAAWPDVMPPPDPILTPEKIAEIIADIEMHVERY